MSEVHYEEREPEQPVFQSRILILGDRLRMDYGSDEEDYVLFDRKANMAWHISRASRSVVGITSYAPKKDVWPKAWKLSVEHLPSEGQILTQVRVNDQLCAEFKIAPAFKEEASMLRDFRRSLVGNHSTSWAATPTLLRHPCELAMDVREAGIEYRGGLPLAVRYWDGRSRVYVGHRDLPARPELFELPADFQQFVVPDPQSSPKAKQPRSSQRR